MNTKINKLAFGLILIISGISTVWGAEKTAELWLTNPDQSVLFKKQKTDLKFGKPKSGLPTILVDASKTYQTMDGFGFCLTGGSALHLNKMDAAARAQILKEMFATDGNSIGVSYTRLSIGASDLSDHIFTYNDLPDGETDVNMEKFSIDDERKDLLPVIKEILAIYPEMKIMGSPWTAPSWMKTNNKSKGGSLKPEFYDAYALYFVKYIQAMKSEGIRIDAITIQNEALHPGNQPSMYMTAEEQAAFIKKSLGPAFKKAGIDTKIIIYDHNADRVDYPMTILKDPDAAQYVDGSAFHLYAGSIDALTPLHDTFPNKNIYFTEQWVGAPGSFPGDFGWHVSTLMIGAPRNWCRTVLEWNLAADPNEDPHTDEGGCGKCLGAITIDSNTIIRNPAYYAVAQISKFVRPGSVRIDSNLPDKLSNVAFTTPYGKTVVVVRNESEDTQSFNIEQKGKAITATLLPGAAGTFVW